MWQGAPSPGADVAGRAQGRSKKSFVPFAVQVNLVHTRLCPWAADGTNGFPKLALSARRFWRTAQRAGSQVPVRPGAVRPGRAAQCRAHRPAGEQPGAVVVVALLLGDGECRAAHSVLHQAGSAFRPLSVPVLIIGTGIAIIGSGIAIIGSGIAIIGTLSGHAA